MLIIVASPWSSCPPYIPQILIDYPQVKVWQTPFPYFQNKPKCVAVLQVTADPATVAAIQNNPTYFGSVQLVK